MKFTTDTMLIFDLDGTLWDSGKEVADSWNEILIKYLPEKAVLDADSIHAVMGWTMEDIALEYLPDLDAERRKTIFDECQDHEIEYLKKHGGSLFEGVRETLCALKAKGYRMTIVSNCQTGYIDAFLSSMHMQEFFCDYEEWGAAKKTKAENIRLVMDRNQVTDAIYIGDIERDMIAAHTAELPFVHAAYGFGKIKDPDYRIQKFEELKDLFL